MPIARVGGHHTVPLLYTTFTHHFIPQFSSSFSSAGAKLHKERKISWISVYNDSSCGEHVFPTSQVLSSDGFATMRPQGYACGLSAID